MSTILPYMLPRGEQTHITENYVSSPPALVIVDETGALWTLGTNCGPAPHGEFAFDVLRNGIGNGAHASRIECRCGKVRIFTHTGWRNWSGRSFV